MINYLSKFIKKLSSEAIKLRELDKKDTDWHWDEVHQQTYDKLKNILANVDTLKYFNPKIPITIQCDAS